MPCSKSGVEGLFDAKGRELAAGRGVAIPSSSQGRPREADYLLYVDGRAAV